MSSSLLSQGTGPPSSLKASKSRKRKRVHENIAQLAQGGALAEPETRSRLANKRVSDENNGVLSQGASPALTAPSHAHDGNFQGKRFSQKKYTHYLIVGGLIKGHAPHCTVMFFC